MARNRARPHSDPRALQAKVDAARQAVAAVHNNNAATFHSEAGKRRALHKTQKCEDKDPVEAMAQRLRAAMKDEALMIKCWTRFAGLTACASVQQFRRVFPTVDSLNAFICCAWDIEGTTELRPWSATVVTHNQVFTWLMNPLQEGATLRDCKARFGSEFLFERAFLEITGEPLPEGVTGKNWEQSAAGQRAMDELFDSVTELRTVDEVAPEIQKCISQYSAAFHYCGPEQSFWEGVMAVTHCEPDCHGECRSCMVQMVDFGQVVKSFLKPVRDRLNTDLTGGENVVLNQSVTAVLYGATWRPPHLSQNDAGMLLDCLPMFFKGLSKAQELAAQNVDQS